MQRLAVLFALVGCNQVFGLEETIGPPPVDSDKDGVADDDDNCVLVANDDQANGDDDTLGDACDPCVMGPQSGVDADEDAIDDACDVCPTGSNHNEDGDTLLDGCDNCPGIDNETQLDADADEIGDACDRSALPERRTFFDAFAPPDPMWNTGFTKWNETGEGLSPDMMTDVVVGPWNRRADVKGGRWQVTVAVRVPPATDMASIGIGLVQPSGSTVFTKTCTIDGVFDRWEDRNTGVVQITDPMRFTLEYVEVNDLEAHAYCWVNDQRYDLGLAMPLPFHPTLHASRTPGEFLYIDVVQP